MSRRHFESRAASYSVGVLIHAGPWLGKVFSPELHSLLGEYFQICDLWLILATYFIATNLYLSIYLLLQIIFCPICCFCYSITHGNLEYTVRLTENISVGHSVILLLTVSRIQNQLLNIILSYAAWWLYLRIYLIDFLHCNLYYPDFMEPEIPSRKNSGFYNFQFAKFQKLL